MTIDERVKTAKKQLAFALTLNPSAQEWHNMLVSIVKAAYQDGVEATRKTCAAIARGEVKAVSGPMGIVGVDVAGMMALKIAGKILAGEPEPPEIDPQAGVG